MCGRHQGSVGIYPLLYFFAEPEKTCAVVVVVELAVAVESSVSAPYPDLALDSEPDSSYFGSEPIAERGHSSREGNSY